MQDKTILEMARLLTGYKVRQIDVLVNDPKKAGKEENRYHEFYKGIRDGKWKDDDEIAAHFKLNAKSTAYRNLKNGLKRRMYNSILFIDQGPERLSDLGKRLVDIKKQLAIVECLFASRATEAYYEATYKCLEDALYMEDAATIVALTNNLTMILSHTIEKAKEYSEAMELHHYWTKVVQAEWELKSRHRELNRLLIHKKGYKFEYAVQAEQAVQAVAGLAEQYPHVGVQYPNFILKIFSHWLRHEWSEVLNVTTEAITVFNQKDYTHKSFLSVWYYQQAIALTMLDRYEKAAESIAKAENMAFQHSLNWFKSRELGIVNAFYAKDYPTAWQILKDTIVLPQFSIVRPMDQETWKVYQGYLYFLVRIGRLALPADDQAAADKFRLSTLLNSVPLYNRDKEGGNIIILLLQSLFLISEGKIDELEKRVEAMRKYQQRNLDPQEEHYRTNCFIRLLELVTKHQNNLDALQSAAAPILKAMSEKAQHRTFEVEVVPYEHQWEWITAVVKGLEEGV